MKKIFIVLMMLFILSGCGTTVKYVTVREPVGPLPDLPKTVKVDNGHYDKSKYPDTIWVKKPVTDADRGRAYWSFEDVSKISDSLSEWPNWADKVIKIVEAHDKPSSAQQGNATDKTRSWFRFWK